MDPARGASGRGGDGIVGDGGGERGSEGAAGGGVAWMG